MMILLNIYDDVAMPKFGLLVTYGEMKGKCTDSLKVSEEIVTEPNNYR